MTERIMQILDLLNQGCTYTQIQEALHVSPKVISAVKKEHFPLGKYSNDGTSSDYFHREPHPPPEQNLDKNNENNQYKSLTTEFYKHRNTKTMGYNEDDEEDDVISSKLELEKYRLQLAHELEMEKIQSLREERERELRIKERELNLKHEEMSLNSEKKEEEKRNLLFLIKEIVDACIDGETTYEEAQTLLNKTKQTQHDCEHYCFVNNIKFAGTESHNILSHVISTLIKFIDDFYENDDEEDDEDGDFVMDLAFGTRFRQLTSKAKFQSF